MNRIIVFSQNLKLESFFKLFKSKDASDNFIFITTHFLFENEREFLNNLFPNAQFCTFADLLSDEQMSQIDSEAYLSDKMAYETYLSEIKKR